MIKRFGKAMAWLLALSLAVSGTAGAQTYSDVPDSLWSAKAINSMSAKNIVPGYKDATFRPDQRVSKLEALTASYRIFKAAGKITDDEVTKALINNKTALNTYKVPADFAPYESDALSACAYALEKGILKKDELKTFIVSGKMMDARKLELSVYMGKMLNVFEKKDMDGIISLSYKDAAEISQAGAPYVNLLIEKNVLSAKGDVSGKFNPGSTVNRAVLATMLSGLDGYLSASTKITAPVVPVTPGTSSMGNNGVVVVTGSGTSSTGTGTGATSGSVSAGTGTGTTTGTTTQTVDNDPPYTFDAMVEKNSMNDRTLQARDGAGRLFSLYYAGVSTQIDGKPAEPVNLQPGHEITVTATTGVASKITVSTREKMISGAYQELSQGTDQATKTSFKVIKVKTKAGGVEVFRVTPATKVYRDGDAAALESFAVNDTLSIVFDGMEAKRINCIPKVVMMGGVMTKDSALKAGNILSLRMPKGKQFDWVLEGNLPVTQAARPLEKGDIVRVYLQDNLFNRIEATGMKAEDRGRIREIHLADSGSRILIRDDKNRDTSYTLAPDFKMYDGTSELKDGFYAFRLGQDVSIKAEMDGVKRAVIAKEPEKSTIRVTAKEVIVAVNMIKVTDDMGKDWVMIPKAGSSVFIADFRAGDKLELRGGKLSDGIFEAESATRIQ